MNEYILASVFGLVQGLTEFLPISSSGHLILTGAFLGEQGERLKTFEVVIQFGSILAVLWLYWPRFRGLLRLAPPTGAFAGPRGLGMLFLTCLPAGLLGLCARSFIKEYLFNPLSVALALAVGALCMLAVEWIKPRVRYVSLDEISPAAALGIGCCQCLSLWPGFSRSASTIMGGMLLGAPRALAAEYSFIAAVPIMTAAASFDLYKSLPLLGLADWPFFMVGTVVSFLAALGAIKLFVGLVSRITLRPFAFYRLLLAPLVFWCLYS